MKNSQPSIDGFIPRRRTASEDQKSPLGLHHSPESQHGLTRSGLTSDRLAQRQTLRPESHNALTRSTMDESLAAINEDEKLEKKQRRHHISRKKLIKRILIGLLIILLLLGAFLGIRAIIAGGMIFRGDLLGLVQSAPLKTDANGRSNIVVFGTSEDNYEGGQQHEGAYLTDSMMVVSIDQEKNDAYMVSLPRDLWVQYDAACNAGYEGRLNEIYGCYSNNGQNEVEGARALQQKVSAVTGLEVQYYSHLNYTVVKDAVDAVGGIEVMIESDDPRGVYDPNFDWQCNYQCNYVKYPNGSTGTIDGEHALALARARNAQGGYGLSRGNFDREQYQQKIMRALVEKAVSVGTLTNIGKVSNLIDALGSNLRTNFETKEIRTLMRLATDISQDNMISLDLANNENPAVQVGSIGSASIVRPVSGIYDYSSIIQFIRKNITSDPAVREGAKIGVYNGSGVPGVAQLAAEDLSEKGLLVDFGAIGNAPVGNYQRYEVYDLTNENPLTSQKLGSIYGVTVRSGQPPVSVIGMDFVVIIGQASEQ